MSSDLRPLLKTPVFVEEDHHHVLPHIFRCVGAKYLPTVGNALVHFDSHPDLLIPSDIVADDVKNVYSLYNKLRYYLKFQMLKNVVCTHTIVQGVCMKSFNISTTLHYLIALYTRLFF